jgi:hypothetical protein
MALKDPPSRQGGGEETDTARGEGQSLGQPRKHIMVLLLAYGANKETTMDAIRSKVAPLSKRANLTAVEYLTGILGMLKEAEEAIPDVMALYT